MTEPQDQPPTIDELWTALLEAGSAAEIKGSKTAAAALDRAAAAWGKAKYRSTRDVTSLSGPELALYKEELPQPVVYHHQLHDHPGHPHGSSACRDWSLSPRDEVGSPYDPDDL